MIVKLLENRPCMVAPTLALAGDAIVQMSKLELGLRCAFYAVSIVIAILTYRRKKNRK